VLDGHDHIHTQHENSRIDQWEHADMSVVDLVRLNSYTHVHNNQIVLFVFFSTSACVFRLASHSWAAPGLGVTGLGSLLQPSGGFSSLSSLDLGSFSHPSGCFSYLSAFLFGAFALSLLGYLSGPGCACTTEYCLGGLALFFASCFSVFSFSSTMAY